MHMFLCAQAFDWLERNATVRLSLLATYLISEARARAFVVPMTRGQNVRV